jgi:tRNA(Ile)-lysidine synthase
LKNGWEIRSEWIDNDAGIAATKSDQNTALMDASALNFPLSVRRRKPGDVFQPLGMQDGSLTLGDFFTNEKLPGGARPDWPLVISGERIAWVAGVRIADFARVQKSSRRLVRLQLIKSV